MKKTNERKKAKKAASVAKESSSTTPSRGRQTKARNSNTNSNRISPAADKIRRKASVQTPPTKNTASFGNEETKPLGTSRDKPETPPRSTLIEYGSASRPTTHHKYDGFAVKSVSMASEELSYKTPERQLLTMPTRRNSRTPSLEQRPSESSSKGSLMTAMVGRGVTRGSVESSSRSTPSKRGASSVIESAR